MENFNVELSTNVGIVILYQETQEFYCNAYKQSIPLILEAYETISQ